MDTCGTCGFCLPDPNDSDAVECWANPPSALVDTDGDMVYLRQLPVEEDSPACWAYRKRTYN